MSQKVYIICDKNSRGALDRSFIYIAVVKWKKLRDVSKVIGLETSFLMFGIGF